MSLAAAPFRALLLLLVLCGCSALAHAQSPLDAPAAAPWVQVEVVVFRHLANTAADEAWPAAPALAYPEPLAILIAAGSPAHNAALASREFDLALGAEEGSAAQAAPVEELPFLRLAGNETVLGERAARLAASSSWRLLEQLAWRQPMPGARPVSVLITAGAQVGAHYEVEGYLTLSRARYLHADVTLWLNELRSGGEDGQLLPEVPLPREPAQPLSDQAEGLEPQAAAMGTESEELAEPVPAPVQVEPVRSTRTVVLHTARRLAPGEVHYLDHPLFGVLLVARSWDPATGAPVSGDQAPAQDAAGVAPPPVGTEAAPPPDGAEESPPPD